VLTTHTKHITVKTSH